MEILDPMIWEGASAAHERARVERMCALITGDPGAASDLAQETLLQAWLIRDRLVDPTGASRWLDAIARNVCHRWRVDHARRLARETATPDDLSGDIDDPLTSLLEHQELVDLLDRALALLPADTRTALVGRYVEELSPTVLADRLGASPEAVSMRITRGRARLRELLETDLGDEPLAQVWVQRHGSAWRDTRLSCPTCGLTAVAMQRDRPGAAIRWRCSHCDTARSVGAEWSTDNPTFAGRLADARRPSTVVARMADWAHQWWTPAIEQGHAPCTRCGERAVVAPYVRLDYQDEGADERCARGWAATCKQCGEEQSTSLLGLLVARPEARRLRERRARTHAIPTRTETQGGRPVLVVGLHDDASGEGVRAVYDADTTRPLGVVAR